MSLYVMIRRGAGTVTNYGPASLNVVTAVEIEVGGADNIGTATIRLKDIAAGYDIRAKDYVQIFESADGVNITNRLFLGHVQNYSQEVVKGTNLVWWTIVCQDMNIQLDWLRSLAVANGYSVNDGGHTTFGNQINHLAVHVSKHTAGGSPTFEAVVGNALAAYVYGFDYVTFQYSALTLRDMITARLEALVAQSTPSTYIPRFYMGYTTTGVYSAFRPQLNIYDAKVRLDTGYTTPKYTFSTTPTGAQKAIRKITRTPMAGDLKTSVQFKLQNNGVWEVARATSTNTGDTLYPNIFDERNLGAAGAPLKAWDGPVIETTVNGADAGYAQRKANEHVAAYDDPAESIEIITDAELALGLEPGDVVHIYCAELGLNPSGGSPPNLTVTRPVASVSIQWEPRATGDWVIVRTIVLGNQLPEIDNAATPFFGNLPVAVGDAVNPNPPTGITGTFSFVSYGALLSLTGTASTSTDALRYHYYFTVNGIPQSPVPGIPGTPPALSIVYAVPLRSSGSVYVRTEDRNGRFSNPSNIFSWIVADTTPVVNPPTALTKTLLNTGTGYALRVGLTHPAITPASPYKYRYHYSWIVGVVPIQYTSVFVREGELGSPPLTTYEGGVIVPYTSSGSVYATTIDFYGNESAASTPVTWTTSDTPRVPTPMLPNGDFLTPSLSDPTQPDVWEKDLGSAIDADASISTDRVYEATRSFKLEWGTTVNDTVIETSGRMHIHDPAAGGSGLVRVRVVVNPQLVNGVVEISTRWRGADDFAVGVPELWYSSDTDPYLADTPNENVKKLLTVPAGTTQAEIQIVGTGGGAANEVWVSALSMEALDLVATVPLVDSTGSVLCDSLGHVLWEYSVI